MTQPNLIIFYVSDSEKSALFYEKLFGLKPKALFPTYAAFEFDNGLHLGLWSVEAKDFISGGTGHRGEIAIMVKDDNAVLDMHNRWQNMEIYFEQPPHRAVFGLTFVALDPDGHRIRVCLPDE
ncbi:MAG: VOC family protein [Rhodospirillaceae bacterium]|nr:VOC family protein [Rhodospirillaceae bacterium]